MSLSTKNIEIIGNISQHIKLTLLDEVVWRFHLGQVGALLVPQPQKMVPTSKYANFAFLFNSRQDPVNCPTV